MDESTLISEVLASDMRSARRLYELHFPAVYRLMYRFAGDRDTAQDWTQETFILVFRHLPTFRREGPIAPWIRRIATNLAMRRRKQTVRVPHDDTLIETVPAPVAPTSTNLSHRIASAVQTLPEPTRMVFVMYDVEGRTHPEIAEALGIPVGTSKARLARARAYLRASLADLRGEWGDD